MKHFSSSRIDAENYILSPLVVVTLKQLTQQLLPNLRSIFLYPLPPPVHLIKLRILSLIYKMLLSTLDNHKQDVVKAEVLLEAACWQSLKPIACPATYKIKDIVDSCLYIPMLPTATVGVQQH